MACATVYWGENFQGFFEIFMNYGAVVDIRPLLGKVIGSKR
jgi:hypothetical protein